jgi:anti-anti-sigma factor
MAEPGLISLQQRDGVRLVTLTGEHDLATVPQLHEAIEAAVATGDPVVVDLTPTAFVDSSVIGLLIAAGTGTDGAEPRFLALVMPQSGHVARVMEMVTIAALLPTYGSVAEAMAAAEERCA